MRCWRWRRRRGRAAFSGGRASRSAECRRALQHRHDRARPRRHGPTPSNGSGRRFGCNRTGSRRWPTWPGYWRRRLPAPLRDARPRLIQLAEHAAVLTRRQNAVVLDVLAAAQAAAGHFDRAVSSCDEALALLPDEPLACCRPTTPSALQPASSVHRQVVTSALGEFLRNRRERCQLRSGFCAGVS